MKISIITPCFNAATYIAETIKSIAKQTETLPRDCSIEHIIIDGASKDQTLQIIEKHRSIPTIVISEPDQGMYDALGKGLKLASGDIVGYLNAGDLLAPRAFATLCTIFKNKQVEWITGINTGINNAGDVIDIKQPTIYRQRFIQAGYYGQILPFIQQESTFWRRNLISQLDLEKLKSYRLAGDYYLWHSFSKRAELYVINTQLGAFRRHPGQLSGHLDRYLDELRQVTQKTLGWTDRLKAFPDRVLFWMSSAPIRKKFSQKRLFVWTPESNNWQCM